MIKLPPWVVGFLGIVFGLMIGAFGAYFIVMERYDAEQAIAEKNNVIEGEQKATEIRKKTVTNKAETQAIIQGVKDGKITISDDGKRVNDDYTKRLHDKVIRAQSIAD